MTDVSREAVLRVHEGYARPHGHARQARFRVADLEIMDVCDNMSVFPHVYTVTLLLLQSTRDVAPGYQKMYTV